MTGRHFDIDSKFFLLGGIARFHQIQTNIPAPLEAIIMQCLEKSPEDRFQTVEELGQALAKTGLAAQWSQQDAAGWWQSQDSA